MATQFPTCFVRTAASCAALAFCVSTSIANAQALQPLSDDALSAVQGRDGLSFDLHNFTASGDARITYQAPSPSNATLYVGNIFLTRSDDPANPFGDPFRLDVVQGGPGLADVISLAFPENANGAKVWQAAVDWGINADNIAFEGGSLILKDAVFYGGGLQLTTPRTTDGVAFGLGLRADIGNVLIRPRGRDDISQADAPGITEQLNLRGVRIGAVDSDGNFLNTPWRVADTAKQPGILHAVTESDGTARLRIGIDWPDASGAPLGGVRIDNVSFRSDVTGNLDLGSSRIGSIQLQYLDVRFRP